MVKNLEDVDPMRANRLAYIVFLWVIPGVFSLFAGFFALWILSDRVSSPLWLEIALKFETCLPVLYLIFGIWAYVFTSSPKQPRLESTGVKRYVLLWIIPFLLLASQILITVISWDP